MERKIFEGKVISAKMTKTVVVAVEVPKKDPFYGKRIRNTKKFMAHNDKGAIIGNIVKIQENRPLSKHKSWIIVEVAK